MGQLQFSRSGQVDHGKFQEESIILGHALSLFDHIDVLNALNIKYSNFAWGNLEIDQTKILDGICFTQVGSGILVCSLMDFIF